MTEEAFIRIACTAMAAVGIAILAATLGGQFGLWASGAVLLVVGLVIAWPMWMKHLDNQSHARDAARFRPESARQTPSQPEV